MNDDQIEKRDAMQDAFLKAIELPKGQHYAYDGEDLGFSTSSCKCCGSRSAGDRFKAYVSYYLRFPADEIHVCTDCINFIANGDLPETWNK